MKESKELPTDANAASDQSVVIEWWLGTRSQYGYVDSLEDGPHSDRDGVEQALYLIRGLGLERDRKFCCVRIEQSDVDPIAHDVNEDALSDCRMMVDRASR